MLKYHAGLRGRWQCNFFSLRIFIIDLPVEVLLELLNSDFRKNDTSIFLFEKWISSYEFIIFFTKKWNCDPRIKLKKIKMTHAQPSQKGFIYVLCINWLNMIKFFSLQGEKPKLPSCVLGLKREKLHFIN